MQHRASETLCNQSNEGARRAEPAGPLSRAPSAPQECERCPRMYPLVMSYPTLAVSAIYCIWNTYLRLRVKQELTLRQRVAFMLWVMANPLE